MTRDDRPFDDYEAITCPMTGCNEDLHMAMTFSQPLLRGSTANALANPDEAYTASWAVECVAGHVVVLPKDTGMDSNVFGDPEDPDNDDVARLTEATGWTS